MKGMARMAWAVAAAALMGAILMGCSTKIIYKQMDPDTEVIGVGYGWGENAEETARQAAIEEATALAIPRSLVFSYLRATPYTLFKTDLMDSTEVKVSDPRKLPDGGVEITAKAMRSSKVKQAMRLMRVANFEVTCEGDTFRKRVEGCRTEVLEKAMEIYALDHFSTIPEKLKGNYTFLGLDRKDDGKKMVAKVAVIVGFLGQGKLTKEEKSTVLMNAWLTVRNKNQAEALAIFKRAMKINPGAGDAYDFAMYEMGHDRIDNAIMAIKLAIQYAPQEVSYLKILYQLYKKKDNAPMMAEVEKQLKSLEMWEENPGADLTTNITYTEKIKWTEGTESREATGVIYFREIDESEMKDRKYKVEEE